MAIEAGRVLSERYRLIRPVGQGSQASVWVAEHLALTTHVAVKLIDPELAKRESARERFRREATAAAQLRSAHVVQILDHGIDGDQPFIVMELLDGEDLFERLAHRTRLSLRETSKIVTPVARALSRAHAAGIVHRDLKPENVFLCPNEDDEVVKVLDFGVAKVKDAAKVTMQKTGVGTLIGTPHYMSPEQVKGIVEVDYHADLWALGIIAFQCVTGELPYDSEGVGDLLIKITIGDAPIPSHVYPGVHPAFDAWFAKACARDMTKRFQSARELALALAAVVAGIDGVAPRAPTVRPPPVLAPVVGSLPIPRAPRAVTEQLDATDWEEVDDDEDDAPTRMKEGPAPTPRAFPAPAPAIPKPTIPSRTMPAVVPAAKVATMPPRPTGAAARVLVEEVAPPPPPPPREPIDSRDGHDIVDFDETIPAHDLHRQSIALPLIVRTNPSGPRGAQAALVPLSEPPRAPDSRDARRDDAQASAERFSEEPAADEAAASGLRARASEPASGAARHHPAGSSVSSEPPAPSPPAPQAALLAPVVVPSRPAIAPSSSAERAPPLIPRPPASVPSSPSRAVPPSAGSHPSAAPVVTPVENPVRVSTFTEPPPEFDGSSKRRRMVRFMVATLVICAVGITWSVVHSQFDGPSGATVPADSATAAVTPPPPPPPPPTSTATAETAVDPGKVTHPTKPTPTLGVHHGPVPQRARPVKPPGDGTIVVPEPDEDSVPAAP